MKRYVTEWIVSVIQILMFYVYPIFAIWDPMGMVMIILLATTILSIILGMLSGNGIRFVYPLAVSAVFVPTVWIYYNESALVHAVWYLVISAVGVGMGAILRKLLWRK